MAKEIIVTHHKIFTIVRNPYTRLLSFFNEFKRDLDISTLSLKEFIENDSIQEGLNNVPYNIYSLKTNQLDNFRSIDGSLILHKFFKMETDITQLQNFLTQVTSMSISIIHLTMIEIIKIYLQTI